MECHVNKTVHFRRHLLFAYNRIGTAIKTNRVVCDVHEEGNISQSNTRLWFLRFKKGNFERENESATVHQMSSMRSASPVDSRKSFSNQHEHWLNRWIAITKLRQITLIQWAKFWKSLHGINTRWIITTRINAQQFKPDYWPGIAEDTVINSISFIALSLAV